MPTKLRLLALIPLILTAAPLSSRADDSSKVTGYLDAKTPVEDRVRDLLARMTLEEKIAQMDQFASWDAGNASIREALATCGMGSMLGEFDTKLHAEILAAVAKSRLKIPVLFGIDACHGNGLYSGATIFPTNIAIAATFNRELGGATARASAGEVRARGHHWVFTPTLDVTQDPRFGRSGETFGECPYVTSAFAETFVKAFQRDLNPADTVAACPKHYVGGGVSQGGVNHASAEISDRTLRDVFLKPFKAAVDAGTLTIMAGHNDVNGIPMHANKELLTDVLKGELGFTGLVVSDMGDMDNLAQGKLHNTAPDRIAALVQSINAGLDIHMNSRKKSDFIEPILRRVNDGAIPLARIDDAVSRILRVKFKLGLFDHPEPATLPEVSALSTPAHKALSLRAARESLTLLRNEGALLPLERGKYKRILVTGPNADNQALLGDWTFFQPEENVTTVLEGVRELAGPGTEVAYAAVGRIKGKPSPVSKESAMTADPRMLNQMLSAGDAEIGDGSIDNAVKEAAKSDLTIVVIGGYGIRSEWGNRTYGESCDSPSIGLPGRQLELVKALKAAGKPVVAVIISGKVCNEPWVNENIPAILYAWEPGQFGGRAVAETLFGDNNPSGRLPFTFPKTAGHIPNFYYRRASRLWTGYSLGTGRADDMPSYEFGYGLSYTTFRYSELTAPKTVKAGEPIPVSVKVTNTGKRAGAHSVLLFTSAHYATVAPALKELKGFEKITLAPGETREVTFVVKPAQLAFHNAAMKEVIEPGPYTLRVGDRKTEVTLTPAK